MQRRISLSYLAFLVVALCTTVFDVVHADEAQLKVNVYEGPSANGGTCPSEEETISAGDYAKIHYTVSLDESSAVGTSGQVFDTSRGSDPIGLTLGKGEVIPGFDEGLVGLCRGDKATLVIPPSLAYGDAGAGDIPAGATLKFDVEVMSVMEGPYDDEDEMEAENMFHAADTDKDSRLSREEFDAMFLGQIGDVAEPGELAAIKQQLETFWQSQDADSDGYLSLEEFLAPSAFDSEEDPNGMSAEEEYAALDTDQDGKLSREEIETFFASLEQEVPDDFWEQLDEDKDGFISFEEFFVEGDQFDEDEEYYGEEDEVADEL